jgi:hypothetical protein
MALNNNDQTRIREFLLGKLSEAEQQHIEERLLVDDDLLEELEISKSELVEQYCSNELSREEHQWFERHFLTSPEGKERHSFTAALNHLQRKRSEPPASPTFFDRLRNLFKLNPSLMAVAGTAAVVVIVGGLFLFRPGGETVVGPTLASNIINREQGNLPAKVTIPANASEMKFRLLLPSGASPSAGYRAELDNMTEIKPAKVVEHDRDGVWVVVPVSQLPRGEYSLRLVGINNGTEREIPGDYLFNID